MDHSHALVGRVAIVTGGSRGIGLAIAEAILARGGKVAITGLSQANLDAARARLGADDRAEPIRSDVRHSEEAAAMVDSTVARFGGLDILVNNAGVGRFAHAADMTVAQWHDIIETNLSGVFYCCHAAIPHLRARGGGWIVNVRPSIWYTSIALCLPIRNNWIRNRNYCLKFINLGWDAYLTSDLPCAEHPP